VYEKLGQPRGLPKLWGMVPLLPFQYKHHRSGSATLTVIITYCYMRLRGKTAADRGRRPT